jgi:CRP/FNR family transcriptional regulator, anaerobic regulatory protein
MTSDRDMATLVAGNSMLRACAESTQRSLLENGTLRSFEGDSLLFADEDSGDKAFFLLHGSLQILKSTNRGRRQIVCNPDPTTCEGVCMLFFGPHGLAEVRGIDPGQILVVEREQFETLTREDPVFGHGAWNGVAHCMAHLHNLVAQLSFNKVSERVVTLLLDDTIKDGDLVRMTQADLAANVGTTREVVARCLAGLQADGLIRLGRGRVTVLHREKLRQQI